MGTNYYWVKPPRHGSDYIEAEGESLHICKLSGGWMPLFQGYPMMEDDDPYTKSMAVASVAEWKRIMAEEPEGYIRDEYMERHSQKAFWDKVESWKKAKKKNIQHLKYMAEHHPGCIGEYWVDKQGYEFDKRKFS
jgi:hypothetical protein